MTWVTLHEHGGRLKDGHGDLSHRELLVVCLLCRDDRSIAGKHEVDARIWHKVCLELSDINVEGAIKAQRGCKGGDDLRQETVQVGVSGPLNVQVTAADVVQSLIVVHDGDISVLQEGVNAEDRVVRFDHGGGNLWASPDGEAQLG